MYITDKIRLERKSHVIHFGMISMTFVSYKTSFLISLVLIRGTIYKWGEDMAFSKGKRIEDETSKRIVDLAVNIGCKEGADSLTVTRLCRELNCDRRVIYNRFRDVDEINMIVAQRCSAELVAKAKAAMNPQASYYDNFIAFIVASFAYIYEKNAYFQYYTALYRITEDGIRNGILQNLADMIEAGKASGDVREDTNSYHAAENMWLIITGIGSVLASNANYKYQDGLDAMLFGIKAIVSYMQS